MVVAFLSAVLANTASFSCVSSKHRYELYFGSFSTNECDARQKCHDKGGYLADVDNHAEFMELITKLRTSAPKVQKFYIHSWQTDTYGKACIVFYQGGAITADSCAGPLPYICEFDQ